MDLVMKKVAVKYHTYPDYLVISPESQPTNSMWESLLNILYKHSKDICIIGPAYLHLITLYVYVYFITKVLTHEPFRN